MLRALGAVQLDTISVLARSHELVAYARLGPVGRARIEDAYWGGEAFEYWSHAASILPQTEWPWFAFRRRRMRERQRRWHAVHRPAVDAVREQLASDGALTTKDLGGAKASAEWWDWSEAKIAVEWLLDVGEVVCVERRGWRRVYDLAERAIPAGTCCARNRATRRASSASWRRAAARSGSRPVPTSPTTTACCSTRSTA